MRNDKRIKNIIIEVAFDHFGREAFIQAQVSREMLTDPKALMASLDNSIDKFDRENQPNFLLRKPS